MTVAAPQNDVVRHEFIDGARIPGLPDGADSQTRVTDMGTKLLGVRLGVLLLT
jgi:hypothetical protein